MNESTSPTSNHKFPAPKVWSLYWKDLPDCAVLISRTIMSSDEAIVSVDHRKELALLLSRESLRGYLRSVFLSSHRFRHSIVSAGSSFGT